MAIWTGNPEIWILRIRACVEVSIVCSLFWFLGFSIFKECYLRGFIVSSGGCPLVLDVVWFLLFEGCLRGRFWALGCKDVGQGLRVRLVLRRGLGRLSTATSWVFGWFRYLYGIYFVI